MMKIEYLKVSQEMFEQYVKGAGDSAVVYDQQSYDEIAEFCEDFKLERSAHVDARAVVDSSFPASIIAELREVGEVIVI